MNNKNAISFLVLGLVMQTTPLLAQLLSDQAVVLTDSSVRSIWVQFMSWVIGGTGLGYLVRDAAVRMPTLLAAITPERLLRPVESQGEPIRLPVSARIGLSS